MQIRRAALGKRYLLHTHRLMRFDLKERDLGLTSQAFGCPLALVTVAEQVVSGDGVGESSPETYQLAATEECGSSGPGDAEERTVLGACSKGFAAISSIRPHDSLMPPAQDIHAQCPYLLKITRLGSSRQSRDLTGKAMLLTTLPHKLSRRLRGWKAKAD